MERKDRFKEAFEYLKNRGSVHTQRDVALKMDSSEGNISKAFKGDERVLTNRFLRRFNEAYGNIFNLDWLIDGVGDMIVVNNGNILIGDGNTNTHNHSGGNTTNNRNTTTTTTNNYGGCGCGGDGEGEGNTLTSVMYQTLFDELSAQRKVTEKAQEQIDTLLDIIKGFAGK